MILLSIFTLSSSYIVGTVTAMYAAAGSGDLVLEAVFITATVFIVLTVFTLQSKWDFSFLGAGLGMSLWILILWGLFGIIFVGHTIVIYCPHVLPLCVVYVVDAGIIQSALVQSSLVGSHQQGDILDHTLV